MAGSMGIGGGEVLGRVGGVPGGKRTARVLAPADLDELLEVGDFGGHGDGDEMSRWRSL